MSEPIYLDYAAATPLDGRVLSAMQPYFTDRFYNPSATYLAAKGVAAELAEARGRVARRLGAKPAEIIFTAGGTEANNLAIRGVLAQYPDASVVVSGIEHDSVIAPASQHSCRLVKVLADGSIDLSSLEAAIDDTTVLVSVMYANNEVGTIQPLKDIAAVIRRKRMERSGQNALPLYFHSDACQAGNYLDLHVSRLGVDMMTLNGGKLYGPKQSGALYVSASVQLWPLILGGGQERGLRSGTENIAGAVGFAKALDIAADMRTAETKRLQALQGYFFAEISQQLPAAVVNGSRKKRLPNNLHITLPGTDNERLLMQLEQAGILAAAGSACSASDEEPSHVLRAMGISDADTQASLRLTMGRGTNQAQLDMLLAALKRFVA
jgi:cysteine desulfurase